jgi:hypothetical protein
MNLSRNDRAPQSRPSNSPANASRVFRYRHLVNGCPLWYCIDLTSKRVTGIEVIYPGMDECAAVARLVRIAYGPHFGRPTLRLLGREDGVSARRPLSPAVLARVCRSRLSELPALPQHP